MAKTPTDIRSLARSHTKLSIGTLVGVMVNPKAMSSAKVAAAREMLNRGWGAHISADELGDNRVIINILKLAIGNGDQSGIIEQPVTVRRLTNEQGE